MLIFRTILISVLIISVLSGILVYSKLISKVSETKIKDEIITVIPPDTVTNGDEQTVIVDQVRQLQEGETDLAGYTRTLVVSYSDGHLIVSADGSENTLDINISDVEVSKWVKNFDVNGNLESWSKEFVKEHEFDSELRVDRPVYIQIISGKVVAVVLRDI